MLRRSRKDAFDIVTVEETPESAAEVFYAVSSFRIRNGMIWGDTNLKYVAKPNRDSEQIAREIAKDYLLGRVSDIPVIFNGRAYVVNYDGTCLLTVVEKDAVTVHFTYRYSRCRQSSPERK